MACTYTYQGKTYSATEFDDVLRAMSPMEASKFMPGVSSVPVAPFVTDTKAWVSLGIKRAIQHAVSSGVDGIVFATGQQNADLYDLSKQVERVAITKTGGVWAVTAWNDGTRVISKDARTDSDLAEIVGKDLADRAVKDGGGEYTGLDLKVGGEGMRAFYDVIIPSVANEVLRKLGVSSHSLGHQSKQSKVIGNSGLVDAKAISDLVLSKPFIDKGFYGLNSSQRGVVQANMIAAGKNSQVLNSIIRAIPVDVVNVLRAKQLTPEMFFHDPAMLVDNGSIKLESDVPGFIDVASAFVSGMASYAAEVSSGDVRSPSVRTNERGSTLGTIANSHDVTPSSSVGLEAGGADTSSASSIVRQIDTEGGQQPGFLIPESLRAKVEEGLPLFVRGGNNEAQANGEALTDDRARQDIRALERAISNYYKGTKNAQGAYEAAPVPDDGLTIIARAFGARLRVFRVRGNGKDFGFFDGVHLSGNSDTVYVNESSTRPHLAVLGHELAHHLRTTNPALYARLVEQIKPYIREDRYAAWSKLWVEKGDKLQEEFVGEVLSDGFMNKTFWQAMAKKDRGLVRQIYTALVKLLQKAFGQYSPKTEAILSDYAEVMRIAGEVMAEAGIDARTALKIAGVDGSTLDTALSYSRADQRGASIANKQNVIPGFQATPATAPIIRQPPLGLPGGISGNQASWSAPIDTAFDDFVYKYQNKHVDTKRVVQSIQAGGKMLADQWNAYLQEELYHGRAAGRVLEFVNQELEPLTKKMLMRGVTMAELDQYLLARHATEANALIASRDPGMPDGGSGMFDADAAAYFAGLDPQKRQRLDATAKEVDAMIEQTRQLYVDYGLESKDTIDGWRGMFDHYVPLKREDMDGGGTGLGQGFSIKGREAKHRTGSTSRKVVDILANIALQRESVIVRGEKNRVVASLIGMAKLNPNKDFWEVGKVPTERVLNNKTGLIETVPDHNYKNRDNVITAKVKMANGDVVEVAVVFNEKNDRAMRMAEALKNLDVVPLEGVVMPMFAMTTRWIASVNTQYNPVFGFVNLTRDVSGAVLNLNSTPLKNHKRKVLWHTLPALHGIYSDVRADRNGHQGKTNWSNLWDEFKREGGITGYRDMYRNSADRARDIQRKLDPHAWMNSGLGKVFTAGGALKVPYKVAYPAAKWLFDWLSDFNLTMENAVRLASYKVATEQGMSKQQAASLAKNLTVNFNRKGQVAQQAGAMYAFFNASVQGTARIAETITTMDRPGDIKSLRVSRIGAAIVGGGVMLGVVQAVMLALAGFDDDDPPEFVRERNLIIPLKPLTGEKNYIAIPMPLGYHVFPNIGRLITEAAIYGKPGDRALDLMGTIVSAFNPVGGGDIVSALAPSLADPVVDLLRNKDWTGKQIYREDFGSNETPGFTRTKDTASGYAKAISEWVNDWTGGTEYSPGKLSPTPDQIDYAISQVTGGVGREFGKASQTVGAMVSGEELPSHKVPLFGRFYGSSEGTAGQAARFYANLKEANRHDAEIKGRLRDNKPEDNYLDEHPEAYWMAESGNHVEAQVRRMRGMKRKMIKDGASRDEVREIDADIAAIMREYNADVAEIKAER